MFFVSSIILRAKHELASKAASKGVLWTLNTIKIRTLFLKRHQQLQRDHDIAGQVAIFLLGGTGNRDHMSKQQRSNEGLNKQHNGVIRKQGLVNSTLGLEASRT